MGLVSVLVSFTPVRSRSPTAARSEAGQVTDGGGSRRTLANLVGKRVGGNPSGVRISYPPPPLTSVNRALDTPVSGFELGHSLISVSLGALLRVEA